MQPHIDQVAAVLSKRAPGTQGKVWWRSERNRLADDWLLQVPDCWGELHCGQLPPGPSKILDAITRSIGDAERSVDFAGLYQPPNGLFRHAIVAGLKRAIARGRYPRVRMLIGVPFGHPFTRPNAYLRDLANDVGGKLAIQVAYMATYREIAFAATTSWDHSKVLDVDGAHAIVGGMNYWDGIYLSTASPVGDISMQVDGPAAKDVSRFEDLMWSWTCDHRHMLLFVYYADFGLRDCIKHAETLPPRHRGDVEMMTVGRLGNGIEVPGEAGKESPPIPPSPVPGDRCISHSDTNDSRRYEYRNPGEIALRALIATATSSIFISQQDLLSCQPKPNFHTEAYLDARVFAALGAKVAEGVPITIVLSDHGSGDYGAHTPQKVAKALTEMVAAQQHIGYAAARELVCRDVGLGGIHNAAAATWPNGNTFSNHAKLVAVDNRAFYIGSENLYPARLQEVGIIVESAKAGATLKAAYLDRLWHFSRPFALIDPPRSCGQF